MIVSDVMSIARKGPLQTMLVRVITVLQANSRILPTPRVVEAYARTVLQGSLQVPGVCVKTAMQASPQAPGVRVKTATQVSLQTPGGDVSSAQQDSIPGRQATSVKTVGMANFQLPANKLALGASWAQARFPVKQRVPTAKEDRARMSAFCAETALQESLITS